MKNFKKLFFIFLMLTPILVLAEGKECTGLFGGEFGKLLQQVLQIMQYLAPILVIVFSSIDFIKATVLQDKEALNKALKTATTRLVLAVALFFIPFILNLIINLFGTSCVL